MSSEAHDTSAEVNGTQADKINTGALGTLVAVGLLAMLSITAAVTALVRHDIEGEEAEKAADSNAVVIALKNSQRALLNGPSGYVDRDKGVVTLPIEVAKSVVVGELQKDPNSATPPAPPATASAAAPAAEASATPPAGSATPAATPAGAKPGPAGTPAPPKEKTAEPKPAPASSGKPAPATAPAPALVPSPTPTAATPGAQSPGPVNH